MSYYSGQTREIRVCGCGFVPGYNRLPGMLRNVEEAWLLVNQSPEHL